MPKCKACGADILFLITQKGKTMPVNAEPVTYEPDPKGKFTLLGQNGVVEKGRLVVAGSRTGYVPHWVTCPEADRFRKRGR